MTQLMQNASLLY